MDSGTARDYIEDLIGRIATLEEQIRDLQMRLAAASTRPAVNNAVTQVVDTMNRGTPRAADVYPRYRYQGD